MLKRTKRTLERMLVGAIIAGAAVVWPYRHEIMSTPSTIISPHVMHAKTWPGYREKQLMFLLRSSTGIASALLLAWLYDLTKKRNTTPFQAIMHKNSLATLCGVSAGLLAEQYIQAWQPYALLPQEIRDIIIPNILAPNILTSTLDYGGGSLRTAAKNLLKILTGKIKETTTPDPAGQQLAETALLYQTKRVEDALAKERQCFRNLDNAIDSTTVFQELIFQLAKTLAEKIGEPGPKPYALVSDAYQLIRFGYFAQAEEHIAQALAIDAHPHVAFLVAELRTALKEQEHSLQQWHPHAHTTYTLEKTLQERAKDAWNEAKKRLENTQELHTVQPLATAQKKVITLHNPFLAESIVLAAPRAPEERPCIDWEEKTLQWYARMLGENVPTPLGWLMICGEEYFVEQRVGTKTLREIFRKASDDEQHDIKNQATELLARIHTHTPYFAFNPVEHEPTYLKQLLTKSLAHVVKKYPLLSDTAHALLEELEPVYAALRKQPVALNKDTHPDNWTLSHAIVRAIDFGCTPTGPRKGPVLNNLVRLADAEESYPVHGDLLIPYLKNTAWNWQEEPAVLYATSGVYDHLLCAGNRMNEYLNTSLAEKKKASAEHLKTSKDHLKKTHLPSATQATVLRHITELLNAF